MLASNEMKELIDKEKSPVLMLTPANTEATISRTDLEEEVIKSVRYGKIEFLKIVLDSGDEQKIFQIEREAHLATLKLSLTHHEHQFLNDQKKALNEYIDKHCNGENATLLKTELHDRLKALNDAIIERAIKQTIDTTCQLKNKFKILKIEDTDVFTLQAYYYNHFKQYEITIPIQSPSALLEKIRSDIANLEATIENLTKNCHDLVDKMKKQHAYYEQFIADQKAYFINILSINITKIPFRFNFKPSDKKHIDEFLSIKISPNYQEPVTGNTLLHTAIDNDREDIFDLLLEKEADPFMKNKAGINAYEKTASLSDPKYFIKLSTHIDKQPSIDIDTRNLSKEIMDVIGPMLKEASVILQNYGITLKKRKTLNLFLQIMLHYEPRIHSRSKDYVVYVEKLRMASRDGEPNVFFNEVLKRARNAPRGLFNNSSLHDPLYELMLKFGKVFDTQAFNELKKQVKIPELPYKVTNQTDQGLIRKLTSDLKSAHNEIELLKAKLKRSEEKLNKAREDKSHSLVRTIFC